MEENRLVYIIERQGECWIKTRKRKPKKNEPKKPHPRPTIKLLLFVVIVDNRETQTTKSKRGYEPFSYSQTT
jgi:hypothetical protein